MCDDGSSNPNINSMQSTFDDLVIRDIQNNQVLELATQHLTFQFERIINVNCEQ